MQFRVGMTTLHAGSDIWNASSKARRTSIRARSSDLVPLRQCGSYISQFLKRDAFRALKFDAYLVQLEAAALRGWHLFSSKVGPMRVCVTKTARGSKLRGKVPQ